jgi:hypothetical protein
MSVDIVTIYIFLIRLSISGLFHNHHCGRGGRSKDESDRNGNVRFESRETRTPICGTYGVRGHVFYDRPSYSYDMTLDALDPAFRMKLLPVLIAEDLHNEHHLIIVHL